MLQKIFLKASVDCGQIYKCVDFGGKNLGNGHFARASDGWFWAQCNLSNQYCSELTFKINLTKALFFLDLSFLLKIRIKQNRNIVAF